MILSLQKLEFLFNAVQGLWNSELEGLACSLVRRLGRQARGTAGRGCGRMDKAVSQRREKWVGYKQTKKITLEVVQDGVLNSSLRFTLGRKKMNPPFQPPASREARSLFQPPGWVVVSAPGHPAGGKGVP